MSDRRQVAYEALELPDDDTAGARIQKLYASRMQIEETFRDMKSYRWGLALRYCRCRSAQRLQVLLLVAALATDHSHSPHHSPARCPLRRRTRRTTRPIAAAAPAAGTLILALSLFGCSAQASTGQHGRDDLASGDATAQASGAEAAQPVESTYERESRMEALIASRNGRVLPADPLEEPKADVRSQTAAKEEPAANNEHHNRRRPKKHARRQKSAEHRASAEVASTSSDAK